jgi:GNAT superfamily N-acetyltransferase
MTSGYTLRRATVDDAEALARGAVAGVSRYGEFAPGWRGPGYEQELAHAVASLADPDYHAFVAEAGDGALAGQVAVLAADATALPPGEPMLAHLRNLFVASAYWGTGVAADLLHAGEQDARERGFTAIRLFVAEGQARARRFYEREGWHAVSEPYFDAIPGLTMLEYRRPLG